MRDGFRRMTPTRPRRSRRRPPRRPTTVSTPTAVVGSGFRADRAGIGRRRGFHAWKHSSSRDVSSTPTATCPCGVYDPAQARIEAESVKACQEKYQGSDDDDLPRPGRIDQGGTRGPGQGTPVGPVDRLLQARARREVPGPARQVLEGHQARRRVEEVDGPGAGPATPGCDRRTRQDLLGDQVLTR